MIVRNKPGLWELALAMRGSVLPHIARPLLLLMLIAAAMVGIERVWHPLPVIDVTPFTVFGIALSLFLVHPASSGVLAAEDQFGARTIWNNLLCSRIKPKVL